MTAQPETRFTCDRCGEQINVVLANTPTRLQPPEHWMTLRIEDDMTKPATHLCPKCTTEFLKYMDRSII